MSILHKNNPWRKPSISFDHWANLAYRYGQAMFYEWSPEALQGYNRILRERQFKGLDNTVQYNTVQ